MTRHDLEDGPFDLVAQTVRPGSTLIRSWPLAGGVSAQVTAIEIAEPDGSTERMVVRRHGAITGKQKHVDVTSNEFSLLHALDGAGLAVPTPYRVDISGELLPTPYIVMEYVDGSTDIDPKAVPDALRQMAGYLTRLHALELGHHSLPVLPHRDEPIDSIRRHLASTPAADRIRDALATHRSVTQDNGHVLLHGDYWPRNIVWRNDRIAAVLDWEDAAIGDPLADLAGCRLELLWMFGEDAMNHFTDHYTSNRTIDLSNLPFWELYVATGAATYLSGWDLDSDIERDMRARLNTFVERSLQALSP